MFQEFAHNYIGDLTGKISKDEKAILNSFVDGLISQWTNGNFIAGAGGTALLESMQKEIDKINDPALKQIAAGMVGAIAGKIVGDNAQAGASSAVSTERDNHLNHTSENDEYEAFRKKLNEANNPMKVKNIYVEGEEKSKENEEIWFKEHENDFPDYYDDNGNAIYVPRNVGVDLSGNTTYLIPGPSHGKIVAENINTPSYMKEKINTFDISKLKSGEFYSVSSGISYNGVNVSISLSINQYGDIFQTIELGGGYSTSVINFSNINQLLADSSASYSEGYGSVVDNNRKLIDDRYSLIDTMVGLGINVSGNILNSGINGSISSNGNIVLNRNTNISNDAFGVNSTISIGSYAGRR